jgi:hypothetical protein
MRKYIALCLAVEISLLLQKNKWHTPHDMLTRYYNELIAGTSAGAMHVPRNGNPVKKAKESFMC